MTNPVTLLAPIKLAPECSEADLIVASDRFQQEFVMQQPGIIRRELVRKSHGEYLDIVQFRSQSDAEEVIGAEKTSEACHAFFAVMDMQDFDESQTLPFYDSIATYE